jgi:flagellar basal body-associated protein FliL
MPNSLHGEQNQSDDVTNDDISVALKVFTVCIRVLSLAILLVVFWYTMVFPSLELKDAPKLKIQEYLNQIDNAEKDQKEQKDQAILFWYIMVSPSLALKDDPQDQIRKYLIQLESSEKEQKDQAKELAKFDLEEKVYPEIQDRLTKVNDWLITKVVFAGALLGAFLLQLWWPFWSQNITKKRGKNHLNDFYEGLLRSPQACAVLGIACTVSLFMDLHIRRSLIIIQQLGTWAGEYAIPVLGGKITEFPGWEQFIRMPGDTPGMHLSLIDALQTGALGIITLVLFAFYHWTFQAVCMQKLDEFNRIIYWLIIGALFVFILGHRTSGNFKFTNYGFERPWFSDFWYFFIAWFVFAMILIFWDASGVLRRLRARPASS